VDRNTFLFASILFLLASDNQRKRPMKKNSIFTSGFASALKTHPRERKKKKTPTYTLSDSPDVKGGGLLGTPHKVGFLISLLRE
jgi:hypothetical protein